MTTYSTIQLLVCQLADLLSEICKQGWKDFIFTSTPLKMNLKYPYTLACSYSFTDMLLKNHYVYLLSYLALECQMADVYYQSYVKMMKGLYIYLYIYSYSSKRKFEITIPYSMIVLIYHHASEESLWLLSLLFSCQYVVCLIYYQNYVTRIRRLYLSPTQWKMNIEIPL